MKKPVHGKSAAYKTCSHMNILIIEDETIAAERMQELGAENNFKCPYRGRMRQHRAECSVLTHAPNAGLILMDIELVDGQSFEIFREVDVTCPVIFTTAYDEYALQAFKVHSIDYILKPIQQEDLQRSMDKAPATENNLRKQNGIGCRCLLKMLHRTTIPAGDPYRERFLVRKGQQLLSIPIEETAYFFSEEKVTFLKAADGQTYAWICHWKKWNSRWIRTGSSAAAASTSRAARHQQRAYADFNGKYRIILKPDAKKK
jgi:two-component system response regulator LytT